MYLYGASDNEKCLNEQRFKFKRATKNQMNHVSLSPTEEVVRQTLLRSLFASVVAARSYKRLRRAGADVSK